MEKFNLKRIAFSHLLLRCGRLPLTLLKQVCPNNFVIPTSFSHMDQLQRELFSQGFAAALERDSIAKNKLLHILHTLITQAYENYRAGRVQVFMSFNENAHMNALLPLLQNTTKRQQVYLLIDTTTGFAPTILSAKQALYSIRKTAALAAV